MNKTKTAPKISRPYSLPNLTRLEAAIEKLRTVPPNKITELALEGKIDTDIYDDDTRVRYLALHFVANEVGATAPYFRDMMKSSKYTSLNPIEELIERDRQLIDVHYLFCQHRMRVNASGSVFKALFDINAKQFDWKLAVEFVSTRTSAKTKADMMLAIPDSVQIELNTLRGEAVRLRRHYLNDKSQLLTKRLFDQQRKPRSRMSEAKASAIAENILPLLLASGSPTKAVDVKYLMTGRQLDAEQKKIVVKQITEHKRWLNVGLIGKINWLASVESEEGDTDSGKGHPEVKRS